MKGKDKCRILKEIRRSIAEANDIRYVTEECKHKGDCRGTCPKCEAELRYLERELDKRRKLGCSVTVAGLALSLSMGMTGCETRNTYPNDSTMFDGDIAISQGSSLDGDIAYPVSDSKEIEILMGMLPVTIVPDISQVLSMSEEELERAFKDCKRSDIRSEWSEYFDIHENKYVDKYVIEDDGKVTIEIHFDDYGKIKSCVIIRDGQ